MVTDPPFKPSSDACLSDRILQDLKLFGNNWLGIYFEVVFGLEWIPTSYGQGDCNLQWLENLECKTNGVANTLCDTADRWVDRMTDNTDRLYGIRFWIKDQWPKHRTYMGCLAPVSTEGCNLSDAPGFNLTYAPNQIVKGDIHVIISANDTCAPACASDQKMLQVHIDFEENNGIVTKFVSGFASG